MTENGACCIACGCQCKPRSPVISPDEDSLELISRDIEKLENIIHRVKSQRLRRLNATSSSVGNIPTEILLHIFQLVCSATKTGQGTDSCPQIILGAVSSHWRDIVRSAPELWEMFTVKVSRRNLQNTLPLLQTYLDNNGASFDAVQLDFAPGMQNLHGENSTLSLREILLPEENRSIRAIALYSPPIGWLPAVQRCRSIKNLFMSLSNWNLMGSETPPEFIGHLHWSRSSLTVLHLKRVPINIGFDALLGCPNLIKFGCIEPSRATRDCTRPSQYHTRNKVFPHLQSLSWHSANQHLWNDNLLEHYHFPAVRHLAWALLPGKYNWSYFYRFLSSLGPNIQSLELSTSPVIMNIARWFDLRVLDFPYMEELTFSDFPLSLLPTILQKTVNVRSLMCFKWIHRRNDIGSIRPIIDQFHQFLQSQQEGGASLFRLEIARLNLPWTAEDRAKISRLMDVGDFKVEVVNDGVIMDL
ncbi:hypothetical protein AGABI1DRAFT_131255 [Agaricus bisporus var. burnettii JB137-S8]|uniref:Uncharacterized protein n=1 Tax=Agaricus bisporus var. burnettii (strain JB137-S8 / ATCC MYA-4627 / FGSC 10392) TaxID=597362 RepID=K5X0L1_AGABU|nr:uncharacterized protein AGABI1DRAFT_131255 [Agaricus bisporus var. burnettii JB137-S8]EKM76427.1 hypothetical protein AGABI1DRAFT_131255 [Agaricus bisporus var. burnettii JB137-S8]